MENGFVIYSPQVAGNLLLNRCKLISARPDENCPTKTVFIFKLNENLRKALNELNIKH